MVTATQLRPGQRVCWGNPLHAHILGLADTYGAGPFEVVGVVGQTDRDTPEAVLLKTRLGEQEVNAAWLAPTT